MDSTTRVRKALPLPTDRLALGPQKLQVSPFCLGQVRSPAMVSEAFDRGVNFFFLTGDMHWPLYEELRQGLAQLFARRPSIRDEVTVAVVSYAAHPLFMENPFEEARDAVPGMQRVDLALVGGARQVDFWDRWKEVRQHPTKQFAGVRAAGATFHDRKLAREVVGGDQVDAGFVRYNNRHHGARKDVYPHVSSRKHSLLYNFSTMNYYLPPELYSKIGVDEDNWRCSAADYYRYSLTTPEVDGVLFMLDTIAQFDQIIEGLKEGPLSPEEEHYMTELGEAAFVDET